MIKFSTCYLALLVSGAFFGTSVSAASSAGSVSATATSASKAASSTGSAAASTATVPYISLDPNFPLWDADEPTTAETPAPERGTLGASIIGPTNDVLVEQNPDLIAPPTTDAGSIPNAKWPMSLSANRLATGGWARQQNGKLKYVHTVSIFFTTFASR